MSFVIVGSVIAASTVVTAYGQYQAGKAEEIALKQRAKDEEFRAETEELQRRQELNKTLAANQVAMAMSGIKAEGSPASISLRSAQQASLSEGVIGLSEKLKQAQLVRQGNEAARAGGMRAGATLLSGAADIAKL
tara:strand:- start:697 stop:1101 length:405 start_codon:yes stop_codon:yes gene_type:complete